VADTYGKLKADVLRHFEAKRRKTRIEHFGISDNDLWIAAIAQYYDLVIVSTDSDFTRIKEVTPLQLEQWV
jgi:predicted nucleic acid-binding protein